MDDLFKKMPWGRKRLLCLFRLRIVSWARPFPLQYRRKAGEHRKRRVFAGFILRDNKFETIQQEGQEVPLIQYLRRAFECFPDYVYNKPCISWWIPETKRPMTCSTNSEYYQIIKVFPNCLRGVVVHGAVGQASAGDKMALSWCSREIRRQLESRWTEYPNWICGCLEMKPAAVTISGAKDLWAAASFRWISRAYLLCPAVQQIRQISWSIKLQTLSSSTEKWRRAFSQVFVKQV